MTVLYQDLRGDRGSRRVGERLPAKRDHDACRGAFGWWRCPRCLIVRRLPSLSAGWCCLGCLDVTGRVVDLVREG